MRGRLHRAAGAAAILIVLAGCGPPDVPEDEPAPRPPLPDTLARADSIVSDLEKREAVQRAEEEKLRAARKDGITVVNEFPPPVRRYYPPPPAPYALPSDYNRRTDEPFWKSEAQLLDLQLETALKYAGHALSRMEAASAEMSRRNADTFAKAEADYYAAAADYRTMRHEVDRNRAAIETLRDAARRTNVPPGWARWP